MSDTFFALNRVESRVGPIALVTVDNGEDHTKPTTLGRSAFESAVRVIDELESGEWAAMVVTGKPFVFCVGADIDAFSRIRSKEDAIVRASQCKASSRPPPRQAPLTAATVGNGSARMRPKRSWPARVPWSASSAERTRANSSMSAPTQKTNGFPVTTIADQSPDSSCSITETADSNADRPSVVGLR